MAMTVTKLQKYWIPLPYPVLRGRSLCVCLLESCPIFIWLTPYSLLTVVTSFSRASDTQFQHIRCFYLKVSTQIQIQLGILSMFLIRPLSCWNRDRLLIDPKEHPMLLAEPSFNTQQHREKWVSFCLPFVGWWRVLWCLWQSSLGVSSPFIKLDTIFLGGRLWECLEIKIRTKYFFVCDRMVELMFEKYGVPALFLAKNAVWSEVFHCLK